MGGEGAKERRRLKRLSQNKGESTKNTEFKPKFDKKSRADNWKRKNFSKDSTTYGKPMYQRGPPNKKKPFSKNTQAPQKKKTKSKKPKHLKRKLEQLGENDNETREELLKEMTDFKKKKQKYSVEKEHPKVEVTREKNNEHFSKAESIIADEDTQKEKRPKVEVTPKQNDENPSKLETTVADEDTQKEETPSKERSGPEIEQLKVEKETRNVERKSETVPKDDSEDEDEGAIKQRRQRGRRRRGRKDTSKQIKELKEAEIDNRDARKSEIMAEVEESATKNEVDSKRYCIGRKAITDFGVGKTYTGKVVYVKPFGIFIDIGCHSDAFCHVSRLSDDYVESSNALFKEGDEVNPRVVEIDRRKKKITVSLQSEARLEDERASAQARQQRKNIRKPPSSTKKPNLSYSSRDTTEDPSAPKQSFAERKIQQPKPVASAPKRTLQPPDESTMTPAELKRARKLARRAARREETGGAGEAAQ